MPLKKTYSRYPFSLLGTPNETSWPGVQSLPDYKPGFPQWSAKDIAAQVPNSNSVSVDLISVSIPAYINKSSFGPLNHPSSHFFFVENARLRSCQTRISQVFFDARLLRE